MHSFSLAFSKEFSTAAAVACLDASWLERIKVGHLSDAEIEQIASHLEACPACAATATAAEDFASLTEAARSGAKRADLEPQPVVVELMRRLHGLSVVETSLDNGRTLSISGESSEKS